MDLEALEVFPKYLGLQLKYRIFSWQLHSSDSVQKTRAMGLRGAVIKVVTLRKHCFPFPITGCLLVMWVLLIFRIDLSVYRMRILQRYQRTLCLQIYAGSKYIFLDLLQRCSGDHVGSPLKNSCIYYRSTIWFLTPL